jgi:hypothetical protein
LVGSLNRGLGSSWAPTLAETLEGSLHDPASA